MTSPKGAPPLQPLVLVVDDEARDRELLREVLQQDGFRVEEAVDGLQAMDLVHDLLPDVVLLDVMLPGLNGVDVCRIAPGIPSTTTSQAATTSVMTTTTPLPSTTSTTTPTVSLCLAEKIYGESAEETALLRLVRDELFSQTPEGQALICLYYQWDALLAHAIENDEEITETLQELIDEILPVFEEMLE